MKNILFIFVFSLSSCVITTPKGENKRIRKDIKFEIHRTLTKYIADTCNIIPLLRIIERHLYQLETMPIDERRINIVKDDLIKLYKQHEYNNAISEKDLLEKVDCYLDYVLNPKYEFVPFWKFWKDSLYLKFHC